MKPIDVDLSEGLEGVSLAETARLSADTQSRLIRALENHPALALAQIQQGQVVWANAVWHGEFSVQDDFGAARFDSLFADAASQEQFWQSLGTHFKDGVACIEHPLQNRQGVVFNAEILVQANTHTDAVSGNGFWVVRDASIEHGLRQKVRDLERHSRILGGYPWGLSLVLNKNLYLTYVSPSSEALLGYRSAEMLGEPLMRYFSAHEFEGLKKQLLALAGGDAGGAVASNRMAQINMLCADGSQRRLSYRLLDQQKISRVRGIVIHACEAIKDDGQAGNVAIASVSVAESAALPKSVEAVTLKGPNEAYLDALTGLPNRIEAGQRLQELFAHNRSQQTRLALLWIDLDKFHDFNDVHGYALGDVLLQRMAVVLDELSQSSRGPALYNQGSQHLLARMGGDEFLIALSESSQTQAEGLAQKILERLRSGDWMPQLNQHLGASIGLALDTSDVLDVESASDLLAQAESAALQARKQGGNQTYLFSQKLAKRRRAVRELDTEVRTALERHEFKMFYQPQMHLRTGQVVGVEALLRWQHPERGLLLPSVFIEALYQNKLLDVLTRWTLTQAGEQSGNWQRAGVRELPISVNMTEYQFQNPHLPAIVASVLMKTGMPARNLILEVVETSLVENSPSQERITEELKQLGVRLAIDDFGVGYSSLNYLRRLVVSQVKLGKAFVEGLPDQAESSAIVAAIIAISRSLKFQVIAEQIENQAQVDHLRTLGCEIGQGFFLAAPLQAKEFQELALSH